MTATERSGYAARAVAGLRLEGPDHAIVQSLRRQRCRPFADPSLRYMGVYRRGPETWLLLATGRMDALPAANPSQLASRVLKLVNEARAAGRRCGWRSFAPVPPLQLSAALGRAAAEHAGDMARHGYFEHEDPAGHSPADRVRATGYRGRLVGENIAYGATSAEEVVAGWLHSTGHCENIMDPRFVQMGLAEAAGSSGTKRGLYWDQVLAAPVR